jgi:hypothetical protein
LERKWRSYLEQSSVDSRRQETSASEPAQRRREKPVGRGQGLDSHLLPGEDLVQVRLRDDAGRRRQGRGALDSVLGLGSLALDALVLDDQVVDAAHVVGGLVGGHRDETEAPVAVRHAVHHQDRLFDLPK